MPGVGSRWIWHGALDCNGFCHRRASDRHPLPDRCLPSMLAILAVVQPEKMGFEQRCCCPSYCRRWVPSARLAWCSPSSDLAVVWMGFWGHRRICFSAPPAHRRLAYMDGGGAAIRPRATLLTARTGRDGFRGSHGWPSSPSQVIGEEPSPPPLFAGSALLRPADAAVHRLGFRSRRQPWLLA
ncbi:hypothetical protein ACLOJK_007174 [Asimina triloba]